MPRPSVRDKILDAGLETLHRRGYHACGVQDITAAAGVPKGSFYNHFESKEALGAEVLELFWQRRACTALRVLSDVNVRPLERLRHYFATMADTMAKRDYAHGCLIGNFSAELADESRLVCDRLASVFAGWTRSVETCIREAQKAGEIRSDIEAGVLAGFLVNAWEGVLLRAKVDKDDRAFAQFNDVVFGKLLA